ncbi:MAG: histidine kinase dimerization/phosphoacceptor domain -containing protein [Pseudomonadota bacterium]
MHLLRNISIRVKVLIAPVIMIVALGIVLLIAIQGLESQRRVLTDIQAISLKKLQLLQEFILISEQVQSDVYRMSVLQFMGVPDNEVMSVSERLNTGLNSLTVVQGEILTKWSLDQEEETLLQKIRKSLGEFRHQVQQAVKAVSDNPSFGIIFVRSAAIPFSELRGVLSRLQEYQNDKIESARQHSEVMLSKSRQTIIQIAVCMVLASLFITVYIGSISISKPILAITRSMGQLIEGDLTEHIETEDRNDEIGQMEKALVIFRKNIIEKLHWEKKLEESEERFRNLYNNAMVGLFRTRISDGKPLQINQYYAELAGYQTVEECLQDFVASKHYFDPSVRKKMLERIRYEGEVKGFDAEITRKDNSSVWISFSARIYPAEGYIEGALIDISDLKKAESQLVASLHEKEILLREVHHRVKNNMQMIQSLINLQVDKIKDQDFKKALMESSNRIRVMALVHETLYKSDTLSAINLNTYFSELASGILTAYSTPEQTVELSIKVEPLVLDIDKIIACGLIVNELMTNSLKYAFLDRGHGNITIRLEKTGSNEAEFTVADDGVAMSQGFDLTNLDSLGLRLVRILSENQLDGNLQVYQTNGLMYCIKFPI